MRTRELGWAVLNTLGATILFAGLGAWCGATGGHDDPARVAYLFASLGALTAVWLAARWLAARARDEQAALDRRMAAVTRWPEIPAKLRGDWSRGTPEPEDAPRRLKEIR